MTMVYRCVFAKPTTQQKTIYFFSTYLHNNENQIVVETNTGNTKISVIINKSVLVINKHDNNNTVTTQNNIIITTK